MAEETVGASSPDVDIEPDELPDEIRANHRAWAREHRKVEELAARLEALERVLHGYSSEDLAIIERFLTDVLDARQMLLAVARGEERGASRWEDPLDVPSRVAQARDTLDAPDDQCQGAERGGPEEAGRDR